MDGAERRYDAGALVFSEGEASTEAFMLHEGRIELTKRGAEGAVRLAVLEPGEIFGEMGVIERQPRNATARALEPVRVTAIDADRFIYMLQTQPEVSLALMHKLSHRLRLMDERVAGLSAEVAAAQPRRPGLLRRLLGRMQARRSAAAPVPRTAPRPVAEAIAADPDWAGPAARGGRPGDRRKASRVAVPDAAEDAATAEGIEEMGRIERKRPVHPPDAGGDAPLVLVADIAGDDERRKTWQVIGMLKAVDTLRVEPAGEAFAAVARMTEDVERQARAMLAERGARLLVFGIAGSATELRLLPPYAQGEMRLGGFSTVDPLWLPAPLDESRAEAIRAAVLAATTPPRGPVFDALKAMLPRSVESGRDSGALAVAGLAPRPYASLLTFYGNAAAYVGANESGGDWLRAAIGAYREAIKVLSNEKAPMERGLLELRLAAAFEAIGERENSDVPLQAAAEACRAALAVFTPKAHPAHHVAAQGRLGVILYRQGLAGGKMEPLRQSFTALQAALKVADRRRMPEQWAETMNNFSQLLQLIGRRSHNPDVLQWAVTVARAAVDDQDKAKVPVAWATSQNNLGSALYLLGKAAEDGAALSEARRCFDGALETFAAHGRSAMVELVRSNLARLDKDLPEPAASPREARG